MADFYWDDLMSTGYNSNLKTIGPRMAQLLTALYDRSQTTFTLRDVERITGLRQAWRAA